jgi:hypothetical protein
LRFKANLLRFRAFFQRRGICHPSPRGHRNGRQGRTAGRVTSAPCVASGAFLPHAIKLRAITNSYAPIIMRSPHTPFLRTGVVMPNRDSWQARWPRACLPRRRVSIPRELRLRAFPAQPVISRRCSSGAASAQHPGNAGVARFEKVPAPRCGQARGKPASRTGGRYNAAVVCNDTPPERAVNYLTGVATNKKGRPESRPSPFSAQLEPSAFGFTRILHS